MKKFQWIASMILAIVVATVPYGAGDKGLIVIAIYILSTMFFKIILSMLYNDINK
jgi:hypothetical protein